MSRNDDAGVATTGAARFARLAAGAAAVLAVVLGLVDTRLGGEAAADNAEARRLAQAVTSRVAGGAYGSILRCQAALLGDELTGYTELLASYERAGLATPFDTALARATGRVAADTDDVVERLFSSVPSSAGLDPHATDALVDARCTSEGIEADAAVATDLLERQNAAAAAAADIGRGRARVTVALTLVAVGAALLTWSSEANRPLRPARALAAAGVALLAVAAVWGVTGLSTL